MSLFFILPELFMLELSILPEPQEPPSLAPREPLAPAHQEWLGQSWKRAWGMSGEGRGASF